ncbi:putative ribosomal protein L7/L12 [Trypanosoma theileri]|uniref:Putative ribosomal protein L7/L12 n=1 Tax=Trypanosoma theileri TaxID=67003 RepID=A0A1X0NIA7_9TRYP|nr:putative ribosomal protein L7/L12 [Trypanosoma theileri]ORC84494.1 putative ribosomal protein L7/L12 [Trypanosoma theileri]
MRKLQRVGITIPLGRCFAVGAAGTMLPRGMQAFPVRDSGETIEAIAEAYVNMDLTTMQKFHELVVKSTPRPPGTSAPVYEEMLLQGMGGGGSTTTVAAAAAIPAASSSSDAAAAAGSEAPTKKVVEKSAFDVHVKKYPAANKIKLIKELRAVSGVPLQEAKTAVEKCPGVVAKAMARADAEKLKGLLEGHGAEVELL